MRAHRVDGGVRQCPAASVGGAQPVLPTDEHLRERLRREIEVHHVDVTGGERGKGQRGCHPEVAATATAQRPEQVGLAGRRRGDRLAAGQHHRRRPQCVTHQARVPGMRAQPAAQGVPRGTDRRAGTRRDPPAGRGQRLVHRIQTGRGRHRDQPGGGVVIDSPGQLTQVEHHSSVRRGRPHIGVPTTARSDLEVVGSSECHRLLHVCRRCRDDDHRRRRTVVVGVENLFGRCELTVVRPYHLPADGGGKRIPAGGNRIGAGPARSDPARSENAPAANAPAAPRRNVWREISRVNVGLPRLRHVPHCQPREPRCRMTCRGHNRNVREPLPHRVVNVTALNQCSMRVPQCTLRS